MLVHSIYLSDFHCNNTGKQYSEAQIFILYSPLIPPIYFYNFLVFVKIKIYAKVTKDPAFYGKWCIYLTMSLSQMLCVKSVTLAYWTAGATGNY